ncbi:MAG: hypothetical protein IJ739_02880 [Bacteroidaceae bacterium]|nr:hypothetical protein [Bacteroidaceae bacterium]
MPYLMTLSKRATVLGGLLLAVCLMTAQETAITFSTARRGPVIGPLHYGIFYEEINHAGDGGIYAELIRNGSMEENGSNPDYWWPVGTASFSISSQNLLNGAQKHAMHLNLAKAGDGTRNIGYWGINIVRGQKYRASFWLRGADGWTGDVTLTLESYEGDDLGHATVHVADGSTWQKYTAEITATGSYQLGWFAIRGSRAGTIYIDCVSLMPPTFKDRENGMRRDLAEKLAALHPRFMRFPGGCYIEGGNRYQWRHTVGPVEERLGLYNSHWGYPVSNGMGFHEFLQLAEDLGAEPLFVVNVGLGHGWYQDYQHIEGFIQEALDALEYANGDASTFWGAKRVAAGHPEPFHLRMLEIGNENYNFHASNNSDQSDHYAERFHQFRTAIEARWPEVVCIGNVESWGTDDPTWRNQYAVDVVDEHYYRSPDWFAANYYKYDNASRTSHKIYNGEYAVTSDFGTNGTLKAALGEAIYMAGMERNADVCIMASYAPIFMNENEAQWRPDMIHYNAHSSFGTPSYWAQQMMASNVGHQNITWTEAGNSVGLDGARLGLGSWNTDVTYSNVRVTTADDTVPDGLPVGSITSPATTTGTAHVFDVCTDECTIELDAVMNSGDEGFLITFAYGDANNYVWWNLGGWNNTRHGVEQAVNGSKTTLATADGTIQTGQTYHIKIVRSGRTAKLYLDDTLIHTVTLSNATGQRLYLCAALNEAEDAAIVKVINYSGEAVPTTFTFADATISGAAEVRVMSNPDNYAENSMENPMNVAPVSASATASVGFADGATPSLTYDVPAYSLSVLTIPLSSVSPEARLQPATDLPTPAVSYDFESGDNICEMADGNHTFYTGGDDKGYLDLGNEAAQAIGTLLNGEAYSVSLNLLANGGGHLNQFCWAWNVNNGTTNYAGLINQANNLNWYFERVASGTTKVSSHAGLSQRTWHNVTVVASEGTASIYIDGELRGSKTLTDGSLRLNANTKAWLGRSPFAADARMTDVFFDDFTVYDSALTPAQVLALAQAAAAKSTDCPALHPVPDTAPNADALTLIGDGTEVDITTLLTNPDFADGSKGWEGTPFSAAPGTVAEHYSQLFDTYQVLHNMPAGSYRLSWQGFYRNGNIANAYLRHTLGTEDVAEVYVVAPYNPPAGDEAPYDPPVGDINNDREPTPPAGGPWGIPLLSLYDASAPYTYSPYTYPDNVQTASDAFEAGHYGQQLTFTLSETADVRIGLRHFTPTVYDWACVDHFRLTYIRDLDGIRPTPAPSREGMGEAGAVYDLSGRQITPSSPRKGRKESLPKGIYLVGGQKVAVR